MKQRISLLLLLLCFTANGFADVVKGRVVRADNQQPLPEADVQGIVRSSWGTSMTTTTTDSLGHFFLTGMDATMEVKASMIGYKSASQRVFAYGTESNDTIDLGDLALEPTELMLQEVEVTARSPRITMSGDTIVFHPEGFRLKENATLADLIKKLPGVEMRGGRPYWNNKPIRLIMNGRDVFGDGAILSQLPVEAVNKIKTYNKQSEESKVTGKDDGQEDQVFDVNIKPGFLDKWYGSLQVEGQQPNRFETRLNAQRLSDNNPIYVFGDANTTNHFYESGNGWMQGNAVSKDGRAQYGSLSAQHNWQTPHGKQKPLDNNIGGTGSMSHRDGWGKDYSASETFLPGTLHSYSLQRQNSGYHDIRPELRLSGTWYLDSLNLATLWYKMDYSKRDTHSATSRALFDSDPYTAGDFPLDEAMAATPGSELYNKLVSRSLYNSQVHKESVSSELTMDYKHFFTKKNYAGIYFSHTFSHSISHDYTNRTIDYLREARQDRLWNYARSPYNKNVISAIPNLNSWLTDNLLLKLKYSLTFTNTHDDRRYFSSTDEATLKDESNLDAVNSYRSRQRYTQQQLAAEATWNIGKKLQLLPSMSWNFDNERMAYQRGMVDTTATRNMNYPTPQLKLFLKPAKGQKLDFSYSYKTEYPEMLKTIDYVDATDPLYIEQGNSRLHRSHTQQAALNFHGTMTRHQLNYSAAVEYQKQINPTSMLFTYNPQTAVYRTKPVNVRGGEGYTLRMGFDQSLGKGFRVSTTNNLGRATDYGFAAIVNEGTTPLEERRGDWSLESESQLAYTNDWLEVQISADVYWHNYTYSQTPSANNHPVNYVYGLSTQLTLGKWEIINQISDNARAGYLSATMNCHRPIWNIMVSRSVKKFWFYIDAIDIFNKEKWSFDNTVTAYNRSERWNNWRSRRIIIGFYYRFDAKGVKKK